MSDHDGHAGHHHGPELHGSSGPLEAESTLAFLQEHLPPAGARILDVGCGDGTISAGIQKAGYEVVGVEAQEEGVALARARGIDARHATWPDFQAPPFDVVLFLRSLHHVHDLDPGLDRAAELLEPGGQFLVDDFSWDAVDEATIGWLQRVAVDLHARRLLPDDSPWLPATAALGDALGAWCQEHDGLHTDARMDAAIRERFSVEATTDAPYLYGYLEEALASTPDGLREARRVRDEERLLGSQGKLVLIGRRWVARKA